MKPTLLLIIILALLSCKQKHKPCPVTRVDTVYQVADHIHEKVLFWDEQIDQQGCLIYKQTVIYIDTTLIIGGDFVQQGPDAISNYLYGKSVEVDTYSPPVPGWSDQAYIYLALNFENYSDIPWRFNATDFILGYPVLTLERKGGPSKEKWDTIEIGEQDVINWADTSRYTKLVDSIRKSK